MIEKKKTTKSKFWHIKLTRKLALICYNYWDAYMYTNT